MAKLDQAVEDVLDDYLTELAAVREELAAIQAQRQGVLDVRTERRLRKREEFLRGRQDAAGEFLAKLQKNRATAVLRALALRAFYQDDAELRRTVALVQGKELPALSAHDAEVSDGEE